MALPQSTSDGPICTILEQETYDRYGYWPHTLLPTSKRRIVVVCLKCGRQRSIQWRSYRVDILCLRCHCTAMSRAIPQEKRSRGRLLHGGYGTPEYNSWECMRSRCYRPVDKCYALYGGKGITVCDAWRDSFSQFFADVGPKPSPKHTLDRIDGSKGYEPGNVRWATPREQQNNRKDNRWFTFSGQTLTLSQWARERRINSRTLFARLRRGWSIEQALELAEHPKKKRIKDKSHA